MNTQVSSDVPVPFEAYSGDGPSIFVSYAHADKVIVFEAIRQLHSKELTYGMMRGFRLLGMD